MVSEPIGSGSANSAEDELTRNLRESRPRLSDDLVFAPLTHKGETVYHIESMVSGNFYRVGQAEYVFLSLFDGSTSFAEALAVTAQRLGADALTEPQATQVMTWLIQHQLVEGAGIPQAQSPEEAGLKRFNPLFNKVGLGCPDEFFAAATSGLGWLFHPISVTMGLGIMLAAACILMENFDRFIASSSQVFAPSNWLWLTLTWIALKVVHEMGHGIACKRMGGKVAEVGVVLILFAPLAFVDVTSSWRFASKWKRIGVALAGMYVELLVAAFATIGWVYATSPLTESVLYNVIVTATVVTILFNANPLMKFDGYYVLSDLSETPNLYADGGQAVSQDCRWLFFGTRQGTQTDALSGRTRFIRGYGILSAVWRVIITISIALAAAAMFHKAGLAVIVVGAAIMVWQSLAKTGKTVGWHWRHRPASCLRAAVIAGGLLFAGWATWSWMPNPMALTAPGILEYEDAAVVRSESAGFVKEVFVQNGQYVKAGQPLLQLGNRELESECLALLAELNVVRAKESIAMDERDAAAVQVAARDRLAIEKKLTDKQQQRDRLTVTAPAAGHVVGRRLEESIGTYIDIGEEVLSIGNESMKELVLSLDSDEIDDAMRRVGQAVQVRLGSNRSVTATLARVHPRASLELPHAALAATEGGPLPVREAASEQTTDSAEPSLELLEPRFVANVRLEAEDAVKLACGQRGYARLGLRSDTLGRWMLASTREWFEAKLSIRGQ